METDITKYMATLSYSLLCLAITIGISAFASVIMGFILYGWIKTARWVLVRINVALSETVKEILANKIFKEKKMDTGEKVVGMNGRKAKVTP